MWGRLRVRSGYRVQTDPGLYAYIVVRDESYSRVGIRGGGSMRFEAQVDARGMCRYGNGEGSRAARVRTCNAFGARARVEARISVEDRISI